jgi:hypothetical protein
MYEKQNVCQEAKGCLSSSNKLIYYHFNCYNNVCMFVLSIYYAVMFPNLDI